MSVARALTEPAPSLDAQQLVIEQRDPAKLRPHPQNSRKHDALQIEQLRKSLLRFGVAKPILIDETETIIAGHATVQAAVAEAMPSVPVVVAHGWSDAQKRAYMIADNRLPEGGRWNYGVLALEIDHLKKIGEQDFASLGFRGAQIATILKRVEGVGAATGLMGTGLQYRVIVDCTDEAHQAELLARFDKEGLPCRALIS